MGLSKALERRLNELYRQSVAQAEIIKSAEAKKAELNAELLRLTEDAGDELQTAQFKSKVIRSDMRVLSVEKLVKAGVKATVIEKCYNTVPKKPYVLLMALEEK